MRASIMTMLLVFGLGSARSSDASASSWTHGVSDDALTIERISPGALVLRLGVVGSYWQPDSPANVSVYADGRVVVVDPDERLGYATFVVDSATGDELLRLAGAANVFDEVDYGEVMVTDVGSTRVEVHSDQGDSVVTVWALEHDGDLTAEQREHRKRLRALAEAMEGLATDVEAHTEPIAPFVPDAVSVVVRPVLPGMGPEGTPAPWPLDGLPPSASADDGYRSVCFAVPSADVAGLPDEIDGEYLWTLPSDLDVATPAAVAVSVTAVLPASKACERYSRIEEPRPLTAAELAAAPNDWTSPWTQGTRTTSQPVEEWMALDAMARTVLPAQLGGSWDWNRWSWFDYRFAAAEVEGRRVVDIEATCTDFVLDEEPACTIYARFDVTTGDLLEFAAR